MLAGFRFPISSLALSRRGTPRGLPTVCLPGQAPSADRPNASAHLKPESARTPGPVPAEPAATRETLPPIAVQTPQPLQLVLRHDPRGDHGLAHGVDHGDHARHQLEVALLREVLDEGAVDLDEVERKFRKPGGGWLSPSPIAARCPSAG